MNIKRISGKARPLFSFCVFHFIDDGFTDSLYLLLPFIAAELQLTFSQIGLLKGVFSGAMSLFQFPLGLLGEKIGELTLITAGTFGLSSGFLLLSKATTFPMVLSFLVLAKGTAAGQHGLGSSALSKVFESSGRRAALGTYNFSGDMGKVCIPFLLTVLINFWDWRKGVFFLSIFGFIAAIILYAFSSSMRYNYASLQSKGSVSLNSGSWGIYNRKSFFALMAIGVIDISARTVLLTFLPFVLLEKGISATQVGFALTLLFAGGAIGKFGCGVLAEWFGVIPMVIGTEIMTAGGIVSLLWFPPWLTWIALPFVGIVLNGTSSVLYATVAELISPDSRSRGYGLYYAVTLGIGAISPMFFGLITDFIGLSFSLVITALMVLLAIPLSRYLST